MKLSRRLKGKIAIITRAGTGIAQAIAYKFAKEGAEVFVKRLPDEPIHHQKGARVRERRKGLDLSLHGCNAPALRTQRKK